MKKSIIFLFILAIATGCKREPTSWNIDALYPIMHTQMTIQQAIPDTMISVGERKELRFIYKGNLIQFSLDSLLSMPDTTITDRFYLPIGSITLQPGQVFLADTNYNRYDLGGAKLTQIIIQSGSMSLSLSSTLQETSFMEYSLPTASKNGIPFFVKEKIPAGSSTSPSVINRTYDLSGYTISMTGINNNDYNIVSTAYRAYIDSNGAPTVITPANQFVATNTLASITPIYARGSFGSEISHLIESNVAIDAFKNIAGGSINLDSAVMTFQIENEFGAEISITVNHITGNNTYNNTNVSLQSPLSSGSINLNRATETNGANSSPVATTFTTLLDNSNSNVADFISNLPNEMSYDFDLHINPLGNVSNSNDFVYHNTGIAINLDAEMPLKFNASNLIIQDTSSFKIDSTSQADAARIVGGYINVHATNWYPFSVSTQFYLIDKNNAIIDSIFDTPEIINGALPIFGVVDNPVYSLLKAPISGTKIEHLYEAKNILTSVKINSTDSATIQILEPYFLDLKMIGDFTYKMEIK
tara:strand:+ start:99323 stop:100912 length:1590 start_codon:yes stop_codon:yes gene_type:complete